MIRKIKNSISKINHKEITYNIIKLRRKEENKKDSK
jgi:hypothetical protein